MSTLKMKMFKSKYKECTHNFAAPEIEKIVLQLVQDDFFIAEVCPVPVSASGDPGFLQ